MSTENYNNNEQLPVDAEQPVETKDQQVKPHIVRRNIEDYLAERALKRRLTDIFDDDFLLD